MKRFLPLVFLLIFPSVVLAAPPSPDSYRIYLQAVNETVLPEDVTLAADIMAQRLAGFEGVRVILEVDLEVRIMVINAEITPAEIIEIVTQVGLLELVGFEEASAYLPEPGACLMTEGQTLYEDVPLCAAETAQADDFERYEAAFSGDFVEVAVAEQNMNGTDDWLIRFVLTEEASESFGEYTQAHIQDYLAIVLDGQVISVPKIQGQIIGEGVIQGDFSQADAKHLARVLTSGALPVQFEVVRVE